MIVMSRLLAAVQVIEGLFSVGVMNTRAFTVYHDLCAAFFCRHGLYNFRLVGDPLSDIYVGNSPQRFQLTVQLHSFSVIFNTLNRVILYM